MAGQGESRVRQEEGGIESAAGTDATGTVGKPSALVLVLGGARSGKSAFAERLARASGLARTYVATAEAFDAEMEARIARHRADRGADWRTVEAPLELAETVRRETGTGTVVLADCLTLWLSNVMLAGHTVEAAIDEVVAAMVSASGPLIAVSNEVGLSLVPETPLGRAFRDAQGRLNRLVAEVASDVVFVAAGRPLRLKPAPDVEIAW
ncbi:adenosylcobinamide kinase /adenosylcobinamide-phosphate guanylyltransferase [Pseudoxanthobacter soli DSM 19599]|uniref:Adenosylcobinamide kinase n=1 Tax=Pseudoxanthobacter soli DSM 19599 TaxID=1123029 RepID=A0A1M7ZQ45_9HYPH|nr:adenosylcobinamide kinase /adenosylcobinamide-phosphate guanylyltransferase [Pseudoxanthobacter soli DSM 19599]